MRPPVTRIALIKAGVLFGLWTAYGVLCAWQAHYWYAVSKNPMSWADAFRYELTYAYLWGAFTPAIRWLARRYRLERAVWHRHLAAHIGAMLVLVPVIKMAFDAITMPPTSAFHDFTWQRLFRSVESTFDTGTLLYAVVVLVEHAILYYKSYQAGVVKASQLQTQLIQAQLQALKMQLHPHFLFNTLHTITALVHEDPEMAERTIARLSELLRLFLANSSIHEVTLSEELHILDLYLEIERARFEDRLQVHYDVPVGLREATVPNLVLQPLVENSIRHGLGKKAAPGWISISAERYGETLVLRITDNGAGLRDDAKKSLTSPGHQGMGLSITRGRLESLYGPQQSLVLRNLPTGGVEARITMPFRTKAEKSGVSSGSGVEGHVELQNTDR
ncbi:MAG TPA: histidine kinase [Bryobacteraceae bacterium]|nr:histidine kinase [Bryobacteraceae bacterium]